MQAEVDAGRPLNKAKVYRELAERYGRRPGAWEYRMQNISHVLAGLNQPWIEGLRPASNVGPTATQQLIQLLKNAGSEPSALDDSIERLLAEASHSAEVSGTFSPATTADQRRRVLTSIVRRRGQPQFRANLLSAYEGRCAISNCNVVSVLEAAHVHPYTGDASNDVSNGLLLRADMNLSC